MLSDRVADHPLEARLRTRLRDAGIILTSRISPCSQLSVLVFREPQLHPRHGWLAVDRKHPRGSLLRHDHPVQEVRDDRREPAHRRERAQEDPALGRQTEPSRVQERLRKLLVKSAEVERAALHDRVDVHLVGYEPHGAAVAERDLRSAEPVLARVGDVLLGSLDGLLELLRQVVPDTWLLDLFARRQRLESDVDRLPALRRDPVCELRHEVRLARTVRAHRDQLADGVPEPERRPHPLAVFAPVHADSSLDVGDLPRRRTVSADQRARHVPDLRLVAVSERIAALLLEHEFACVGETARRLLERHPLRLRERGDLLWRRLLVVCVPHHFTFPADATRRSRLAIAAR